MSSVWIRYPRVTLRFPGILGHLPLGYFKVTPIKIVQFSIQAQKEGRPPLLFSFKGNFPHASSTILGHIPFPQGYLLEGTGCQAIRQKIGHILFGFRVVYGEVVFVTISPNRRHSSLLLRLSRVRANDTTLHRQDLPYIIPKSGHEVPQAPPGYLGYFVLGSATLSFIIMIKK